ncbi:carotenoid biosynthesis protein [Aureispira]|nr:carotenoid biosynthesis protein [Aureispira sp.]
MSKFPGVIILMLYYVSFLIGLTTGVDQDWFLRYGASFIYINTVLIFFYQKEWNKATIKFFAACFVVGFSLELILVKSNFILGNYYFGDSLGLKIFGIPFVIGFYWLILSYSAGNLASKLPIRSFFGKVSAGAILQICLILFILQFASRLDLWHLDPASDEIRYCIVWLLFGFVFQVYYHKLNIEKSNRIASFVYGGLWIFFVGLLMFLK